MRSGVDTAYGAKRFQNSSLGSLGQVGGSESRHDSIPIKGLALMKEKHAEISYTFEELPAGRRVRIKTTNSNALKAIHDFLRFQIEDHHTGDLPDISTER